MKPEGIDVHLKKRAESMKMNPLEPSVKNNLRDIDQKYVFEKITAHVKKTTSGISQSETYRYFERTVGEDLIKSTAGVPFTDLPLDSQIDFIVNKDLKYDAIDLLGYNIEAELDNGYHLEQARSIIALSTVLSNDSELNDLVLSYAGQHAAISDFISIDKHEYPQNNIEGYDINAYERDFRKNEIYQKNTVEKFNSLENEIEKHPLLKSLNATKIIRGNVSDQYSLELYKDVSKIVSKPKYETLNKQITKSYTMENKDVTAKKTQGKKDHKKIEPGDLVSIPFGGKFLQGIVKTVDADKLLINNYKAGAVKIPNNNLVHKFFPGQKFDLRELNLPDPNSDKQLSTKAKIEHFLNMTPVKSFENMLKSHKKDVIQLLAGKTTHGVYKGQSLVSSEGESAKSIKEWAAKFQLYRGSDRSLKLDVQFKREALSLNVYGKDVTQEQLKSMKDNNQSVTLDRESNAGEKFKVFARYDKDLNSISTSPYSKSVEEKMKASYAKGQDASKEIQKQATVKKTKKGKSI